MKTKSNHRDHHATPPTPPKGSRKPKQTRKRKKDQSGIAIVTVLSVLLLMSVLMLAFFSGAKSELESSRYTASSIRTKQLADVVTNIVVAQLRQATTKTDQGGIRTTWSSQPGLITQFTSAAARRYEQFVSTKFKLYSSADMQADKSDLLTDEIPSDWDEELERWVDLNAPSYSDLDKQLYFPIVDPRAYRGDKRTNSVEGFSYTDTTSSGTKIAGVIENNGSEDEQRLPMPVEWLYVLDDGTIGHLSDKNKFIATSGTGGPTDRNPISARIAFWTDDESCKVNVNTAAEGIHFDTPRYDSSDERDFSKYQPGQHEYYRFPGHPAMVSLSSVFYPHQDITDDDRKLEEMLELSPKNAWEGSSRGGSTAPDANGVELDDHRLYPTVDEIMYSPSSQGSDRKLNKIFEANGSKSPRRILDRSRFFLTANSNAPEMTLFGTPRMSMWPIPLSGRKSAYDNLLSFCNTTGTGTTSAKYFWQRQSAGSRHGEVYGRAGDNNIGLLWNYLAPLADEAVPGFGRRLGAKYGGAGTESDTFQILTSCWDAIRTTNLNDPLGTRYVESGQGQIASCCLCGGPPSGSNHATGAHQQRWDKNVGFPSKGFGRLYSVSEITLVVIPSGASDASGGRTVEVGVVIEVFCPTHGYSKLIPSSFIQINGPPAGATRNSPSDPIVSINGTQVTLNARGGGNGVLSRTSNISNARWWGAHGGPFLFANPSRPIQFQTADGSKQIPTASGGGGGGSGGGGSLTFSMGSPWRVIMYDNANPGINQLIQVAHLEWPSSFTVPLPSAGGGGASWSQRLSDPENMIRPGDVTRSMVVSHGDYRHVAANRISQPGIFVPHFKFGPGEKHAHSLTSMDGTKLTGFSVERDMIPGANYPENLVPDFPLSPDNRDFASLATGRGRSFSMDPAVTGDWDTGNAQHLDGPYVNRGDEGSGDPDPYFNESSLESTRSVPSRTFFSPNRIVTGPGQFGSMPSGVRDNVPWRTLLFRPDTEHYGAANQPRAGDMPDHLFMDLFWMPVVEPYAISKPFSTSGKINLNYQIIPFDNIKRATALHALMKAERVVAIPTGSGNKYKDGGSNSWRNKIDAYETLQQAEDRFEEGEIFRSPTEICELYLVPEGKTLGNAGRNREYSSMRSFWDDHKLTGDNVKERPYANMQPRLTTKSNVFKVHMIVQTLKKVRSSGFDTVDMTKDRVTGQWRGSAIIERFIDPNNKEIPDYIRGADPAGKTPLDEFYNYRVLHMKQFAP